MPSAIELFGDDSSDSDDDEANKNDGTAVPPKPAAAAAEEQAAQPLTTKTAEDSSSLTLAKDPVAAPAGDKNNDDDEDAMEVDTPSPPQQPATPPPPRVIHQAKLEIPTALKTTTSSTQQTATATTTVHVTKLPNLMGIQMQPYDPSSYLPSMEDEEFGPSAASLVRWRYQDATQKGDDAPLESNTRLVEWEDGSWTLHIGNEAFEMDFKDSSKNDFAGFNGYLYQSQQAHVVGADQDKESTSKPPPPAAATTTTVLECVAPVASRITVHPTSLTSEAHKSLTVAVRQKTLKQAKIATTATQEDPEQLKAARIRASADVHKQQSKSGGSRAYGGTGMGGARRRPRMSRGYLEEEDDDDVYDTTNIRGMKRRMRDGEFDDFIDNDEDDDEEDTTFRSVKRSRRPEPEADDSDGEEEELVLDDDDDDEEEEDGAPVVHHKDKKPAHHNVIDDDDD